MKIKVLVDGDLVLSHLFSESECEEDIYLFWDLMESGQIEAYITPPSLSKILDEISKNQSIQVVKNYYYQITEVIQILPINKILYQKALNLKLLPIKLALEQVCAQTNKLIYLNCKSFVNFCPLCHKLFEFNTLLNTCLDRQSLELLYYLESSYSMIVATPPNPQIRSYLPSDPDETLDMSLSDIIESKEVVDDLGSGIDYLF